MAHLMFGLSPMMQGMPNVAVNVQKHIFEHIKLKAEEDVEAELFKQYGTDPENLVSALQREAMVAVKTAQYFQEVKKQQEGLAGPQTDPLVELKKQELQQGATRDQAKDQNDKASLQLKQQSEQADQQEGQARLALQKQAQDQKAMMDAIKLQQEDQKHSSQLSHDGYKHNTQLRQQGIQHAADLYQNLQTQQQAQQAAAPQQ
jgi:hypothetical protein